MNDFLYLLFLQPSHQHEPNEIVEEAMKCS